jgi:hypothetical protein
LISAHAKVSGSLMRSTLILSSIILLHAASTALAQDKKPASPRGTAQTQVGGKWTGEGDDAHYDGGKWIEIDYGRPIKRGRDHLFGSGADYGKKVTAGAPLWRAGANQSTRLHTEVPIEIGGKRIEPGDYSLFVDLKEKGWTLVVSTQPAAAKYDPKDEKSTWGAYHYDSKLDVVRAPMKKQSPQGSIDQLTIGFVDVTPTGGKIWIGWDTEGASADFKLAK